MKKGPFEVTKSRKIYENPWIKVQEDTVIHPDGTKGIFGTVDNGVGVSVVAINDTNTIYLVREYLYVLEKYGFTTPSGGVKEGQTPLEAAQHELEEEAGVTANTWTELGYMDALTMIIRSPSYLFLAQDLHQGQKKEQDMEVVKMPFAKAHQMVLDSEITHGPSCVAILKAKLKLQK